MMVLSLWARKLPEMQEACLDAGAGSFLVAREDACISNLPTWAVPEVFVLQSRQQTSSAGDTCLVSVSAKAFPAVSHVTMDS